MNDNDNFYLWLELPLFTMSENDNNNLEDILNKKKREWSNGASRNAKMNHKLSKVDEIQTAIKNPKQWRMIYQNACKIAEEEIMRNANANPNITMDWIKNFYKEKKYDIKFIKKVLEKNGKTPELDELIEPDKKFNQSIKILQKLGCDSIYDFLNKFGYEYSEYGERRESLRTIYHGITNWHDASITQLSQAADAIWKIWHDKSNNEKKTNILNICSTINTIKSNQEKAKYDYFLIYNKVFSIINKNIEVLKNSPSTAISVNDANKLAAELNKLTEDDINYSRRVLSKYLSSKGITPPIQCPACRQYIIASAEKCSCGFNVGNYNKINELCVKILELLNKYKFKEAKDNLDKANNLQKNISITMEILEKLNKDYLERERVFSKDFNVLESLLKSKRLYTAQKRYQNMQIKFDGFYDTSIEDTINMGINKCNDLCANALKNPENKVSLYASALEIASDCEIALNFFNTLKIYSPTNIIVSKNLNYDINIVWTPSKTQFVTYTIIRKENEVPFNISDGVIIASNIRECRIKDKNPINGKCYYYGVYASIGNKSSKLATTTSFYVVKPPEIESVIIDNKKVSIKLKNLNTNNLEIVTVKKLYQPPDNIDDGEQIKCNIYGFEDNNVQNNIRYYYKIFAKYNINGQEKYSKGVLQEAVPFVAPEPVFQVLTRSTDVEYQFKLKVAKEETVNDKFAQHDFMSIEFFYSDSIDSIEKFEKFPSYHQKIDKSKLENTYKKLDTQFAGEEGNFFVWKVNIPKDVYYLCFPITNTRSNVAIIGEKFWIHRFSAPTVKDIFVVGREIHISLENCSSILREIYVVFSNNGYTDKFYNYSKFEIISSSSSKVIVPVSIAQEKKYYFSLLAIPENGELYKEVYPFFAPKPIHAFINLEPKKIITYTYFKKLFSREFKFTFKKSMTDKLEDKKDIKVTIVYNQSRRPLTITDGTILSDACIDSTKSITQLNVLFPKHININTAYIGVFLVDNKDYETYQLLNKTNPTGKLL